MQIYHLYNQGIDHRDVFLDEKDYQRALETLFYYRFDNLPKRFSLSSSEARREIVSDLPKLVDVISFCFMSTHFHFQILEWQDHSASKFMNNFCNSYVRYFNTRYKRIGSLFCGRFKRKMVTTDNVMIHLSRYIHLNPVVAGLVEHPKHYPWSSFQEYLGIRSGFTRKEFVLSNFHSREAYEKYTLDQIDYAKKLKDAKKLYFDL